MANDNKLVNLADLKEAFDNVNQNKKNVQTAVSSPTASGTAVSFIDTISQNAQGVIAPTKKTVPNASQSAAGLMSATDKTKLDGIAAGAQVNSITGVKGSEENSYRTGNVSISAENVGALVSDFSELDPVGTFTGNERIPLYLNGENYSTDMQTLLSSAGGGGSNQGAITDYKKVCGPISSLPWTSSADSNITADMYLSYATSSKPSVLSVFDWSTANDGTITISAKNGGGAVTLSESVTLTLYFSVGMSTAPSILTNLGSNTADNILKTAPRPGVYGTLGIANGGTNASSASAARTNLDVYSKSEVDTAIQQSAAKFLKEQVAYDISSVTFTLECEHINILSGLVFTSAWEGPNTAYAQEGSGGVYAFSIRPSTSEVGFFAIKEPAIYFKIASMTWNDTTKVLTLNYDGAKTKFVSVIYA